MMAADKPTKQQTGPSVSVIIPAYNPGPYLDVAIRSVISQTYPAWQLIIVDDGSEQDISNVARLDPRIQLIRQNNRGQSVARNRGIAVASGQYVAFLDQDDVWMPTKLERQVGALEADPNAVLCHAQFSFVDAQGSVISEGFGRAQSYLDLLEGSGICGSSSALVRRDALLSAGLFDRYCQPAEDYDVWLKLMHGNTMSFVPTCEVLYRLHGANQSSMHYGPTYRAIRRIITKHMVLARACGDKSALVAGRKGLSRIRLTFGAQAVDQCRTCLRTRAYRRSAVHLDFALRVAPHYVLRSLASNLWNSVCISQQPGSGA